MDFEGHGDWRGTSGKRRENTCITLPSPLWRGCPCCLSPRQSQVTPARWDAKGLVSRDTLASRLLLALLRCAQAPLAYVGGGWPPSGSVRLDWWSTGDYGAPTLLRPPPVGSCLRFHRFAHTHGPAAFFFFLTTWPCGVACEVEGGDGHGGARVDVFGAGAGGDVRGSAVADTGFAVSGPARWPTLCTVLRSR